VHADAGRPAPGQGPGPAVAVPAAAAPSCSICGAFFFSVFTAFVVAFFCGLVSAPAALGTGFRAKNTTTGAMAVASSPSVRARLWSSA